MAQLSFNRFLDGIPLEHREPVRNAVYNVLTLCLLFVCYNVYLILNPYLKPLLWAMLVGSILHPFKYQLVNILRNWCAELQLFNTSFARTFFGGLFASVDLASMSVASKLLDDWKQVAVLVFFIFVSPWLYVIWLQTYTMELIRHLYNVQAAMSYFLDIFQTNYVMPTLIAYLISTLVFWNPERNGIIRKTSAILWFPLSAYISSAAGILRVPFFLNMQLLACLGYLLYLSEVRSRFKAQGMHLTFWGSVYVSLTNESELNACADKTTDESDSNNDIPSMPPSSPQNLNLEQTPSKRPPQIHQIKSPWALSSPVALSTPVEANLRYILKRSGLPEGFFLRNQVREPVNLIANSYSSYYFKGLFWACGIVTLSKYTFVWPLFLFSIVYYAVHKLGEYTGIWNSIAEYGKSLWAALKPRLVAVVPVQIQSVGTVLAMSSSYIKQAINDSANEISCFIVMFALLLLVTLGSIFIVYQIYSEGMVMVQLFPTVINNTKSLLPPSWDGTVELWMEDAYNYGRRGLSSAAKKLLNETDGIIEEHLLQLWDRIFQTWVVPVDTNGPNVDSAAVVLSWQSLLEIFQRTPDSLSMMSSLWGPVAEYTSVAMGMLMTFLSMVVGGGTIVFNSLLNLLVFLSALFYLLSSSNSVYKPIDVISKLVPGTDIGEALSAAVDQVFIASFKMAVFYGLWSWLTHNFLGANIVFLPSAIAALLAVAPLIPPYLASIPSVLEIWLLQGRPLAGITLFILQMSPMLFGVDTAIYTEIKSGHPYLTCLSIAGGILYMGIEGALLGPLLLCWILCLQFTSTTK